jgi:NTP pyrophosphatase (non-canonical NTP hydrolase)
MAFNRLSDGQAERLAMMIEEAGEIAQAAAKALRHGLESYHPDTMETNREALRREFIDLLAVWRIMTPDFRPIEDDEVAAAVQRKLRYAHHQGPEGGE